MQVLEIVVIALALASLLFGVSGIVALRRGRLLGAAATWMASLSLLLSSGLLGTLSLATHGYRALTHEEVAAVVDVKPAPAQRFEARFRFPDGRETRFWLHGDALYVDAHVLKWKPIANLLGLHTAYELDRVAGRYAELEDEQNLPRTVFFLGSEKRLDLFKLRRRFSILRFLVDAEYGSATFILADRPSRFEVRVSPSGLLIRQVGPYGEPVSTH